MMDEIIENEIDCLLFLLFLERLEPSNHAVHLSF